jgi:hypothetical protein
VLSPMSSRSQLSTRNPKRREAAFKLVSKTPRSRTRLASLSQSKSAHGWPTQRTTYGLWTKKTPRSKRKKKRKRLRKRWPKTRQLRSCSETIRHRFTLFRCTAPSRAERSLQVSRMLKWKRRHPWNLRSKRNLNHKLRMSSLKSLLSSSFSAKILSL